jgi:hypothetical protein
MTFKGQVTIRSKIVTDNVTLKRVTTFVCLRCKILHEEEEDIT